MKKLKSLLYIIPICLGLTLPLLVSNRPVNVKADNFNYSDTIRDNSLVDNSFSINYSFVLEYEGEFYSNDHNSNGLSIESNFDSIWLSNNSGDYFYVEFLNDNNADYTYLIYDNVSFNVNFADNDIYDSTITLTFNGLTYNNDSYSFESNSIIYFINDWDEENSTDFDFIIITYYILSYLADDGFNSALLIEYLTDFGCSNIHFFDNSSFPSLINLFPSGFYNHNYFNQPSDKIGDLENDYDFIYRQYESYYNDYYDLEYAYNTLSDNYDLVNNTLNQRNQDYAELYNDYSDLLSDYKDLQNQINDLSDFLEYYIMVESYRDADNGSAPFVFSLNSSDTNYTLNENSIYKVYTFNCPIVYGNENYNYVSFVFSSSYNWKLSGLYFTHVVPQLSSTSIALGSNAINLITTDRINAFSVIDYSKCYSLHDFLLLKDFVISSYDSDTSLIALFELNSSLVNVNNQLSITNANLVEKVGVLQGVVDGDIGIRNTFDLLKTSFVSLSPIMSIEVIPNITIGMLITIPIVVSVIIVFFKMIS